jgi:hypothetical protein
MHAFQFPTSLMHPKKKSKMPVSSVLIIKSKILFYFANYAIYTAASNAWIAISTMSLEM